MDPKLAALIKDLDINPDVVNAVEITWNRYSGPMHVKITYNPSIENVYIDIERNVRERR